MNRLTLKIGAVALALTAGLFALAPAGLAQDKDWKGFYVGGNVGGAFGSSDPRTSVSDPTLSYYPDLITQGQVTTAGIQHLGPNGVTGGGQIGYDFQHGHFLLGGEFDFGGMSLNSSKAAGATFTGYAFTFTVTQSMKTSWLMTARPRVGYAGKRVLVYGTGGLAATNLNYQEAYVDTAGPGGGATENGGIKKTQTGFAAGGGIEYKMGSHWSLKGEYLYASFGNVKTTSTNLTGISLATFPLAVFTHGANLHANIARAGINFRF
ncbi:MAG: outer membrane beta-barrel protein [Acidobacteriia bacterium]|nr:outer membrane beta-barrel protein [Terriglobia bacterium]